MQSNLDAHKTNTFNSKSPVDKYIPEVLIVHNYDGVYDVYINDGWEISRNHIDNVLQYLVDNIGTFTLKFKDLTV